MLEILILLLLIYNLLVYNPIKNLIVFLSIILLLSIKLFVEEYYLISWIYVIIYGSALLILFTYALMIKYKCVDYNRINNVKEYKSNPYILILIIFWIWIWMRLPIYNIFIFNYINYKSFFIMIYLLYIQPFFIIFLFLQLLIVFLILIK